MEGRGLRGASPPPMGAAHAASSRGFAQHKTLSLEAIARGGIGVKMDADEASTAYAAPSPGRKKGGLGGGVSRIVDRLFGGSDDELESPAEALEAEPVRGSSPDGGRAARRMRGRIALAKGKKLVIEIVLDGDLEWSVPELASVTVGERTIAATVEAGHTTRGGAMKRGQSLRLTLALDEDPAARPSEIAIEIEGVTLVVELR